MALALPWEYAEPIAAGAFVVGCLLLRGADSRARAVGGFLREAALVVALYGLWQWAGGLSVVGGDGAIARAEWISRAESFLPLPSIAAMQHLVLWSGTLTQAANIYYAVVHFPATIGLLIWLYVRHRDRYGHVRWVLALATFASLAIQLMPVAPPRLMPGIIDTAARYGQSVYGGGFGADELAAMPSVHVAWAAAVGWYVWRIASRRWRWIGPAHTVVTVLVVVVTGNHWWLDGIVACLVLGAAAWTVTGIERAVDGHRRVAELHAVV